MNFADKLSTDTNQTSNPDELIRLISSSIDYIRFVEASLAIAKGNERKLQEQVKRQADMITNLEKTLWGNK